MARLEKVLREMKAAPQNVRFSDLATICDHYFGAPRQRGTSHKVYRTPWTGDPRVNIQEGKAGKAKPYQVRQVLAAIAKLKESGGG
ncbi:MAG: hypothetical protein RKE49_03965 [Oceanicaulis sp.]